MRVSIFGIVPASSCVTTFLLSTILLSVCSNAYPSPTEFSLGTRQAHHHHEVDADAGMSPAGVVDGSSTGDSSLNLATPTLSSAISSASSAIRLVPTDPHGGHNHGSHAAPKTVLDDVDIHFWHQFPPTYLAADFRLDNHTAIFGEDFNGDWDPETASGHKGLVVLHVLGFFGAYFGALPIALALRAAEHSSHHLANIIFLVIATLGWLSGAAYNASTPNRYEGSIYPKFVNILLLTSYILATFDGLNLMRRAIAFWNSGDRSWSDFTAAVMRPSKASWTEAGSRYEMARLVEGDEHAVIHDESERRVVFALGEDEDEEDTSPARTLAKKSTAPRRPSLLRQWSPPSRNSTGSEGTLHDSPSSEHGSNGSGRKYVNRAGAYDDLSASVCRPLWKEQTDGPHGSRVVRFGQTALTWIRRSQVVFAYVALLAGITTYTGMCRGSYVNSCAAHYIKGSIFFGYGLLTFARYLGAYADLGWAWNRRPGAMKGVSAEMVECSVIFFYGITNTWLERLGAAPGSSYTVKQVQHISIAIMFWFAGLSGILLESKTVRRILGASRGRIESVEEPPTYAFSFNPLPALVIAVTGLAMAAHHQNYVFQVEIHKLWGILLASGSAFRFLTYFFLWLRPPTDSTLPSRPPTEILTAFGWATGGIVFMLSNEEICFAAMRAGYDDMMAFLNITIALTSLVFCWTVVVMTIKGWGVTRMQLTAEDTESR